MQEPTQRLVGKGPIITYFVEHSASTEWRELSVGEPIDAAECDEKIRPNPVVVIAGWIMVAALIGGAAVAVVELLEAIAG